MYKSDIPYRIADIMLGADFLFSPAEKDLFEFSRFRLLFSLKDVIEVFSGVSTVPGSC